MTDGYVSCSSAGSTELMPQLPLPRSVPVMLYTIIMLEAFTAGIALVFLQSLAIELSHLPYEKRTAVSVLQLTLLLLALIAHSLTVPLLCYALHTKSPAPVIPYMVWRAMLTALVAMMALYHTTRALNLKDNEDFETVFFAQVAPPATVELIKGTCFFGFAFRAHRELRRALPEKTAP